MPRTAGGRIVRLLALVCVVASLAACGGGTKRAVERRTTARSLSEAVTAGRFTATVDLDDGDLLVKPPSALQLPAVPEGVARKKMWATAQLANYEPIVVGLGLVTIAIRQRGVPEVADLPAWVGFAKIGTLLCPLEGGDVPPVIPLSSGIAAVVLGAADGSPVVVYKARTSLCGLPATGPTTLAPDELVSVRWSRVPPVADGSLTVRFFEPPCAKPAPPPETAIATRTTVSIDVDIPDDPERCLPGHFVRVEIPLIPNAGPGTPIEHGQVGAVSAVHSL
jgi:hypothetical protein